MELGLGLLSIGRSWGLHNAKPPPRDVAMQLLRDAWALGIRHYDTAPAYGESESLLGQFLLELAPEDRANLVVSTKVGEFWLGVGEATLVCHKADEMRRSVDRSLALIGKIDILQIHKASVEVLGQHDVTAVIQHAANLKIASYGASVSDLPAARLAITTGLFDWLQFPFSATTPQFSEVFVELAGAGIRVFVNRPLAMGKLAGADQIERAFSFIQSSDLPAGSIVLTGTGVPLHLHENFNAFARAKA